LAKQDGKGKEGTVNCTEEKDQKKLTGEKRRGTAVHPLERSQVRQWTPNRDTNRSRRERE